MAVEAVMQEEIEVPEGGIAELVMDDQTADEIYGADEEEVPSGGIAQFESVAEQMAAMGREGDNMLAHLESGELVIPRRFLEENEEFKSYVMAFFDGQGVDPDRYIAGSESNSINPETGIAEFFLKKIFKKIKKGVKKVGKAVKKVVKKVVKVAKKVAPIVLPIVLGPAGLGLNMMYAGALGAGIGTLVQGGDMKSALKSALIGGALGGIGQGVQSGLSAGQGNFFKGFSSGIKNAATNPMQASFTKAMSGVSSSLPPEAGSDKILRGSTRTGGNQTGQPINADTAGNVPEIEKIVKTAGEMPVKIPEGPGRFSTNIADVFQKGGKGPLEALGDAFFPSGPSALDIKKLNPNMTAEAAEIYAKSLAPGVFAKTLPTLAAGTGIMAVTGGFKKPPQEDPGLVEYAEDETPITGEDKIAADPGKYLVDNLYGQLGAGPYEVGSNYQMNPRLPIIYDNPFQRPSFPQMTAAKGGEVYPRRNGGIMPNEGIPNQDSVRALLMPGEFVMTTDAVKGLGGGDLNQGINNMYSVMRNLESRGRQMA